MTYSVPEKVRKTPFKHQKWHEKLSQTAVYQPFNLFCHLNTKKILQNKRQPAAGYRMRCFDGDLLSVYDFLFGLKEDAVSLPTSDAW